MKFYDVAANMFGIQALEARWILVRLSAELEHLRRTPAAPKRRKGIGIVGGAVGRDRIP